MSESNACGRKREDARVKMINYQAGNVTEVECNVIKVKSWIKPANDVSGEVLYNAFCPSRIQYMLSDRS